MDIFKFLNSKDIAQHLKSLNYEFTLPEAAFLIFRSSIVTLEERFDGWKSEIESLPDSSIRSFSGGRLHFYDMDRFLQDYMDLLRWLTEEFYSDDGGIYMTLCKKSCMLSAEESIERSKREVHLDDSPQYRNIFWIHKVYPNSVEGKDRITACFNQNGELISISGYSSVGSMCSKEFEDVFHDQWFSFPTPFRRGDILMDRWEGVPFVLNYIDAWDQKEMNENKVCKVDFDVEKRRDYLEEKGTNRDMNAVVYHVNGIGKLYQGVSSGHGNYLDLEYYDGDLSGPYETLLRLRELMQHKLDIAEFLDEYEQILANESYNRLYNMTHAVFPEDPLDEQVNRDYYNVYRGFLKEQV